MIIFVCLVVMQILTSSFVIAKDNASLTLDEQIVVIKKELIDLGQEIKIMEDLFLYPPENKVALYVAMDIGKLFLLNDVEVSINHEVVAKYTYSNREVLGLKKGAAHQVFIGNYIPGEYSMTVVMRGIGPHNRQYKRAISHDFEKTDVPKIMQIVIYDDLHKQQPAFRVKDILLCKGC